VLTFGSLFAGIGGFDLGFERAGMECRWQVEIDPYCQRVLAKHWPNVRRHDDVRTWPQPDTERVDVICGGFPCQDISPAGTKEGISGKRSGLWKQFARIVRTLRPAIVVVENSAAITYRGMDTVLRDLAKIGFDAEWDVLSACAFGAPHARERMFLTAYADGCFLRASGPATNKRPSAGLHQRGALATGQVANWWAVQPEPRSVVYGVPGIVDRLRPYGNAVVPQVAEWIGRRIIAATVP
jgi:DNA (cytosine-5)-methyltransferase 1